MCTVKQYMLRGQGRWKNWRLAGAACISKARGREAPEQGKKYGNTAMPENQA